MYIFFYILMEHEKTESVTVMIEKFESSHFKIQAV